MAPRVKFPPNMEATVVGAIQRRSLDARNAGLKEIKHAADEVTPIDTGRLIGDYTIAGGRLTYNAPYAAAVHERFDQHHEQGGPKFLERGITNGAQDALEAIARVINIGM